MSIYLLSPTPKKGTIHLPMIKFSLLDKILDFTKSDLLLFTSSQAVKSMEKLDPEWKRIPCIAIGKSTADTIESFGGQVMYIPSEAYGEVLAADIISKFKDKNILYPRPKVVSFDMKPMLEKEGVKIKEEIIYETSCIGYTCQERPVKNAVIVFTSPSTIHCFLENFEWDESYRAVVIGHATQKHLPPHARFEVADRPLIDACIEKAKEILTANRL